MDKPLMLAAALVDFQSECPSIAYDARNPHFKSRYATLAAIRKTIAPLLAKHGLSVMQFPISEDGRAGVITRVMHVSGEFVEHPFMVPITKSDPQSACSAVSYARRYGLSGALGLVTEEDDDGEAAMGRTAAVERPNRQPEPRTLRPAGMSGATKKKLAFAARERMKELSGDTGTDDDVRAIVTDVARSLGYASTVEMLDSDFGRALEAVQKWEPAA